MSESVDELELRLADQLYALDQAAIVAVTDQRGIITYANQKFCELSKYKLDELIGQSHAIINSGYHSKQFFKDMWQTILKGEVWRDEVCNRAKDDSFYWVDTTIVPFRSSEGKLVKFIAIRYDITHKKATEEQLELEKKRLIQNEKMATMGVLSSGIAHELGNPLGAIRGRLEMLEMSLAESFIDKESVLISVEKMIRNVDRMSKIIRGLKSYARDGSRDPMAQLNVTQLVGDILEISSDKVKKLNIKLTTKGLDQETFIVGRETELGQVIVNLFNNACDAVKSSPDPWVSVELEKSESHLFLKFNDSGMGIPDEIQQKIFDPFYTTKDVGSGTGLGLSICRSIVDSHDGELYVDSQAENTCFVVKIPL